MPIAPPQPGMAISYAYLWRGEHEQGREEGAKNRPVVIVLAAKDNEGDTTVIVAPITHSAPSNPEDAIEIPTATKARLGFDSERSWVVISEVNRFVWPGPDLAPVPGNPRRFDYGFLPPRFFKKVTSQIVGRARVRKLKEIRRQD
ncbi:MAG: type II toxin-antitoxin system PemK/MazF family toxin [Proteobacteria bacterium]|nr:type II toxin-antitoxin system PemK/MazF family toxin [Pseudomonadota bacterium]